MASQFPVRATYVLNEDVDVLRDDDFGLAVVLEGDQEEAVGEAADSS